MQTLSTPLTIESPLVPPRGIERPLEIPLPSPGHALRWARVRDLLRRIRQAPDDEQKVDAALELFDAVGGLGGEATFQRFVATPEGRRLLRTKPDLVNLLGNRDALAAMPEGSFGRAYLAFAERNGFAADNLVEKNKTVERERPSGDEHRQWFWDRFTMSHDLWHVLTDCGTEGEGELRLLAFTSAQTPQRGYAILLGMSATSRLLDWRFHREQFRAWCAGRRANDLVSAPWEQYLAWPLDEVRRCFGVEVLSA